MNLAVISGGITNNELEWRPRDDFDLRAHTEVGGQR